jgi:hypothetical protein
MNQDAQKRFLDARRRYNTARATWYVLGSQISALAKALTRTEQTRFGAGGWNQISVTGYPRFSMPRSATASEHTFDPSKWPTGEQISVDWIEVNQAYHDFEEAYQNLPDDDREYLAAKTPEP